MCWRNAAEKRGEQRFARLRRGGEKALVEVEARLAQEAARPHWHPIQISPPIEVGPEFSPPDRV